MSRKNNSVFVIQRIISKPNNNDLICIQLMSLNRHVGCCCYCDYHLIIVNNTIIIINWYVISLALCTWQQWRYISVGLVHLSRYGQTLDQNLKANYSCSYWSGWKLKHLMLLTTDRARYGLSSFAAYVWHFKWWREVDQLRGILASIPRYQKIKGQPVIKL